MLKLKSFLLACVVAVLFSQCSSDPVQKDLLNYINVELPKLAPLESDAISAFGSVVGANYTNDSVMYDKVKNVVVPKYTEFTTQLQAVVPATDELKATHKEYVEAALDQLEGFKLIVDAIEKQSKDEIANAVADIDKGGQLIAQWKMDLLEDCKKHNVTLSETK